MTRYEEIVSRIGQANIAAQELGELLVEGQSLFAQLHPEAVAQTGRGRGRRRALVSTFATIAAEHTGLSERALRRYMHVAEALAPDVRALLRAKTPAPSQHELLQLAKLPPAKQVEAVKTFCGRSGAGLSKAIRDETHTAELTFQAHVLLALGQRPDLRIWRQNVGSIPVRDRLGQVVRTFHAGPPKGASDLTGVVRPEGFRLEIELKSDGERPTTPQRNWRAMVSAFGAIYVCITYDDAASLDENIRRAVRAVEKAIHDRRTTAI